MLPDAGAAALDALCELREVIAVSRILEKLGASNRTQIALLAHDAGLA